MVRADQHAAATGREKGTCRQDEPDDHALGRSRGGLTTKVHLACDGRGRPLAFLITPGQRHDNICAQALLDRVRVPRTGPAATPPT
ncbi:transposase [Streptomyces pharetrae]|uniref:transposase n=1 Tax=Streptomyces pharetrae TaxID=291370 RepID=UPI003850D9F7